MAYAPIEEKLQLDHQDIAGKNVLVTGGTTGIGRATALLLASHGARVMIFGRHQQALDDAVRDLQAVGQKVLGITADVSKLADVERVFGQIDHELGTLDILIDNAALGGEDIAGTDPKRIQYIVETNLLGYMLSAHEAVKRMKKAGKGHIVLIGSMSAETREPGSSVYVATKSGIQGFAEALRKEINEQGIRVTLIEPGRTGSDMQDTSPAEERQLQQEHKMLKAEDIAQAVYWVLTQPERSDVVELRIKPHLQAI